jgi:TonB-dependent receptor
LNKIFILILISISTGFLFAQTGKIAGIVVDQQNGEGLIGANVYLEGTSYGAATDFEGSYAIIGVPQGSYELVVMMIGYAEMRIQNVVVTAGNITRLEIPINPELLESEVIEVQAEALKNTEGSLLKLRQKAATVSDAISAEEISKSGSGNAASAMTKVTGASIVGGKYVYIRGLGERYSATTLNGAELPSADPDKKAFQLDLIPSNMLDNINTIKTFTPDKPGTFTGGLVDVSLKNYPEQFTFQINSSLGYNSSASYNGNFILGNSSNSDWMGFDSGTRKLPAIYKNNGNTEARPNTINTLYRNDETKEYALQQASILDKQSRAFSNKMAPLSSDATLNGSFGISAGNTIYLDDAQTNNLGYFASLSWGQNYSLIDNGHIGRYKLGAVYDDATLLIPEFEGKDVKGSREIHWGSISNLAYMNPLIGQLKFSFMHTQNAESQGRYLAGKRSRDDSPGSTKTFETRVVSWVERSLNSYQLDGEHVIPFLKNSTIDWKASYSENDQYEPDQRYFFNTYTIQPDGSHFYAFDGANSIPVTRYYRDLREENYSTYLNLVFPFSQWSGLASRFKVGLASSSINRSYNQRRFSYVTNGIILNDFHATPTSIDTEALFNQVGIIDSVSRPDNPNRWYGMYINENIDSTNFFTGEMETMAYYAMLDIPLINNLRLIGGARIESTNLNSQTKNPEIEKGKLDNLDVLPSVNLVYNLYENMNLRTAYSQTIARPTFRELAPYSSFEFVGDFVFKGNAGLKRTLITNYDLRWEWFLQPGELVAVSGFYKDFINPIEQYYDPSFFTDDGSLRSVKNVDKGRVYGLELEIRKNLNFISNYLSDFKVGSNFTLVKAQVDVPDLDLEGKIAAGESNPDKKRQFPGQSPYVLNLNLNYDNYEMGLVAGVYYNLFGDRLFITGTNGTPDVYERGYGQLDFKATKGLFERLSLSLNAQNLLNQEQVFSYTLDNKVVNKDFVYQSYKKGVTISLSLDYKI